MKKLFKYLVVSLFLLLYSVLNAQSLDSLKSALSQRELSDQERLELLLIITEEYVNRAPDSALYFIEKGKDLISPALPTALRLKWWVNEGAVLIKNQQLEQAKNVLLKAAGNDDISKYPQIKGKCFVNLAAVYLHQQTYDKSLEIINQAFPLIEGDVNLEVRAFNNVGILYSRLGDYEKATINLERALKLNISDDRVKLSTLINLAALYSDKKQYEDAIIMYQKAGKLAEKFQHFPAMAVLYSNLSNLYNETHEYELSLSNAIKGLKIKKEHNLPGQVFSLNNVGYANYLLGDFRESIHYFQEALPDARGKERQVLLLNLKNSYEKTGDLARSLNYFDRYIKLKDSLDDLDYKAKVVEIDTKYETEKKQYQIDLLNVKNQNQKATIERKNLLISSILLIGILGIGFIYLLQHQNKIKQKLEKEILQQRLLRMQLNPHFLFHALNGIQSYLYNNQPDKSINYLSSFSSLMRFVLDRSEQEWVNLEEEIEMLNYYLQLQQLNFNDQFTYEISVDKNINISELNVPTLLTQPLLENALIHGLNQIKDGKLNLHYSKTGDGLLIRLTDNGNGYKNTSNNANKMHNSMSTDLIIRRLKHLQKKHRAKVGLEFSTLTDDALRPGTVVDIYLPIVYKNL